MIDLINDDEDETPRLPLSKEAQYIIGQLFPELEDNFRKWGQEYQQERDLGAKGEFYGLYRKVRKLKSVFHDGVDPSNWRESLRTIVLEVAAHAFLLLYDIDHGPGGKRQRFSNADVVATKKRIRSRLDGA